MRYGAPRPRPPDGQNSQAIFRGRQVRKKKTPGRTQSTKKQMPLSVQKSPGEIYNTKNKMPKGRPKTLWHVRKMPGAPGMISGRVIKPRPKIPRVSLILTICTKIARMGFSDRSLGISGQVIGDFRTLHGGFSDRSLGISGHFMGDFRTGHGGFPDMSWGISGQVRRGFFMFAFCPLRKLRKQNVMKNTDGHHDSFDG